MDITSESETSGSKTDASGVVDALLAAEANKSLLRFITCGSVDDGKSTLIGRLLYDTQLVYDDHLAALALESKNSSSTAEGLDFSLLVDGLQAEREQGITIDVAYRFFATDKRKFIVADTPGHEQYTRNMATGASTADLALILIDARKGVLVQTRRHAFIASLLGIRHVVVVINKMDLIDHDPERYGVIADEFRTFAQRIGLDDVTVVPISALKGDNIAKRSDVLSWYRGPTLLEHLETVDLRVDNAAGRPLRFPVQRVNRPNLDFRGFSGTLASGTVTVGDVVEVARSKKSSVVKEILTPQGPAPNATAAEAVTIVLEDEIDVSRGDILCHQGETPVLSDQLQAHLIWMAEDEMIPGRTYLMKIGTDQVPASITSLRHRVDVNTLDELAAEDLSLNELAVVNLATDRPIAIDPYKDNRSTGAFILIDRMTHETVSAGMIDYGLRRGQNIKWQSFDLDRAARSRQKGQEPAILWFTGLSGAGKSTIANIVEKKLHAQGRHVYVLDGDNVRHGLNKDLGFTDVDRVENVRRVAEVARLMSDAGLIVLVSFISPFRRERQMAREIADDVRFLEVYVHATLEEAENRDVKGLYAKARAGLIKNFTGIDSTYRPPENPDVFLDTMTNDAEMLAEQVIAAL